MTGEVHWQKKHLLCLEIDSSSNKRNLYKNEWGRLVPKTAPWDLTKLPENYKHKITYLTRNIFVSLKYIITLLLYDSIQFPHNLRVKRLHEYNSQIICIRYLNFTKIYDDVHTKYSLRQQNKHNMEHHMVWPCTIKISTKTIYNLKFACTMIVP
jgi:hypothetical protein